MIETQTNNKKLEKKFNQGMWRIYEKVKVECNYNATRYLQMLSRYGGLETAKKLISDEELSYGFVELYKRRRLDLTVEVLVTREKYKILFADAEIQRVKKRLREVNYPV